jgi:hypothetical protein
MFSVCRRNKAVATDTIEFNVLGSGGVACAQAFIGRWSFGVIDVYPMTSKDQFVNTLEDNIRRRGAMNLLISDRGTNQISARVHNILRSLVIKDWQSEPYHQLCRTMLAACQALRASCPQSFRCTCFYVVPLS